MKSYVLGFMFNTNMEVCLIQKRKPAWQAGKWNGVGGKIKNNEFALDAMIREFKEETGVQTENKDWRYFGAMVGDDWECYLFTGMLPVGAVPTTITDEVVGMFSSALFARMQHECISNVQALISLALMGNDDGNKPPVTLIDYRAITGGHDYLHPVRNAELLPEHSMAMWGL